MKALFAKLAKDPRPTDQSYPKELVEVGIDGVTGRELEE